VPLNSQGEATWSTGIREIFVSPLLISTLPWIEYQRRRIAFNYKPLSSDKDTKELPSLSYNDIRKSHLLDTFIAGGITGGILNTIRRGPASIGPSFFSSGLFCSLLQYGVNELSVQRIKYFSETVVAAHSGEGQNPSFRERLEKWQETGSSLWKDFLPRKLSDEEYAEKMAAHERRLKEKQAAKERAEAEKKV